MRIVILFVFLLASGLCSADYRPKQIQGYIANTNGQTYADPAADCASAAGTHELTGPDSSGAYSCEGYSYGGSYFHVIYVPNKVCPSGYADSGLSDPANACVSEGEVPPDDDCADKAGQSAGHFVQTCYIVHCPPRFYRNSDGAIACSSGRTNTFIPPPSPINVAGCEATIEHRSLLERPRPPEDVGQTAGTVQCDDEYKFTGQQSTESPSPLPPTPTPPASPPTNNTDRDPPAPPANPADPGNPTNPQPGGAAPGSTTPGGNSGNHSGQTGGTDGPGRNAGNPNHGGRDTSSGNGAGAGGDVNDLKAPEIEDTSSWWESDYEDGLKGVWQEKKDQLLETRMGSFATSWGVPDSGSCPEWTMNIWRVGSVQLQPPCWIWPAIKALMYFCTILLCRALIFGG